MPEPAAWKYQKITKPMFEAQTCERTCIFLGRVITCVGDEVIEDGFVHLKERQDRRRGQARPMRTNRR